jgi:hypothetical protein
VAFLVGVLKTWTYGAILIFLHSATTFSRLTTSCSSLPGRCLLPALPCSCCGTTIP